MLDSSAMVGPPDSCEVRYVFIDALRGMAAIAVLLFHIQVGPMHNLLMTALSPTAFRVLFYGQSGVQVFFVISGFVIVHSIRDTRLGWRSFLRFAVRRQLRLDPPYWVVLLTLIALICVCKALRFDAGLGMPPSLGISLLNFCYLHEITGQPMLLGVSWTLCIEIQFYLLTAAILWPCQKGRTVRASITPAVWIFFITGTASAIFRYRSSTWVWLGPHWCYFAAGALSCWAMGRRWVLPLLLTLAVVLLSVNWPGTRYAGFAGALTATVICILALNGQLTRFSGGAVLQYLGRISYSLYLVHLPIFLLILSLGRRLSGDRIGPACLWIILAILVSFGAAVVLNLYVERPSGRWSQALRKSRPRSITFAAVQ